MLRNEKKYLVPNYLMNPLRKRISSLVRPDLFSKKNGNGLSEYIVRSIYFDNSRLECYYEKIEGIRYRRKFRIRGYFHEPDCIVVMEVKRKIENRVKKHRAFLKYDNLDNLLLSGDLGKYIEPIGDPEDSLDQASRFMYHYYKRQLKPTCLITYDREAYHGIMDPGVRITFDKNIRSMLFPTTNKLFTDDGLKNIFPNHFILEIKYFTNEMPVWARSILQEFRLRNEALSKYALGIDVHRSARIKTF
jgi:hypothetical protein